ncbi:hypothetical protein [Enterococcus crotali]|uniref:hypothetical protein n=1 Tax=Enterococcus crotali TaxID=1453587 RepID=UPI000470AFAE|nr:hypothetical protein [Enterococcus crotali]
MKKKLILLLLITTTLMSACAMDKEKKSSLTANEEKFTWWVDRDKAFGNFEYPAISEKEAMELMKNKFNLKIPDFFSEAKKIAEKTLVSDGTELDVGVYSIFVTGDEVLFSGMIRMKDSSGHYLSYAKIELKYQYIDIQKKVKLQSQSLSFYNLSNDNTFNERELIQCLKNLSDLLELKDQEKLLTKFNEDTKDSTKLVGKEVSVYRTLDDAYKKNTFGKNLIVTYNQEGNVKIIDAVISDYRL